MRYYLTVILATFLTLGTVTAQENKMVDLQPNEKTIYPDKLGLSGNETILSLFQVVPELMYSTRNDAFENMTIKVNGNKDYLDAAAVLRQIRVIDVEKVVIRTCPDAGAGTVGLGGEVNIVLKNAVDGLHGSAALEVSSRGMFDPTVNVQWKNDKWTVQAGASLYWNYARDEYWYKTYPTEKGPDACPFEYEDLRNSNFGENMNVRTTFTPNSKDKFKLTLVQEYLSVNADDTYAQNGMHHHNDKEQKQNNSTAELNYEHLFNPGSKFSATVGVNYGDNPVLNSFRYSSMEHQGKGFGISYDKGDVNVKTFLQLKQVQQLGKEFNLMACERLEVSHNKLVFDTDIFHAAPGGTDLVDADYLYHTINSQTRLQLNWTRDKWNVKLGEVLDYFLYDLDVDGKDSYHNDSFTPQHFLALGYKNSDKHWFNLSYRRIMLRPSLMQLHPMMLDFDGDGNPVASDGKYRDLANATGNIYSFGYTYNSLKHLTFDAELSTRFVSNVLNYVEDHYEENGNNVFSNLNLTLYLYYGWLMTTIGSNICYAFYETEKASGTSESHKLNYNVRWMITADLGNHWTLGATSLFSSRQWTNNSEITSSITADVHVAKRIGKWTLAARVSDIFCPEGRRYIWTDTTTNLVVHQLHDRAVSVTGIYKF